MLDPRRSSGRVAGLNILGIRENARVTFGIFIAAAFVFVNLIALGVLHIDPQSPQVMLGSATRRRRTTSREHGVAHAIAGHHDRRRELRARLLGHRVGDPDRRAWSRAGATSRKAYWFLALTVGIVTPVVSALALSAPIDFAAHEGDLITHWATMVGNVPFGVRGRPRSAASS